MYLLSSVFKCGNKGYLIEMSSCNLFCLNLEHGVKDFQNFSEKCSYNKVVFNRLVCGKKDMLSPVGENLRCLTCNLLSTNCVFWGRAVDVVWDAKHRGKPRMFYDRVLWKSLKTLGQISEMFFFIIHFNFNSSIRLID